MYCSFEIALDGPSASQSTCVRFFLIVIVFCCCLVLSVMWRGLDLGEGLYITVYERLRAKTTRVLGLLLANAQT